VDVDSKAEITVLRGNKETALTAQIAEQPADFLTRQFSVPGAPNMPNVPTPPQPMLPPQQQPPALAPRPQRPAPGGLGSSRRAEADNVLSGVQVSEIPSDHRADLPDNAHGVMVTDVDQNSPAAASLEAGDVIEEINRQPINSVQDFERAVQALRPNEKQMLLICRGKTRSFVIVTPS
jgi:hypothetical protein